MDKNIEVLISAMHQSDLRIIEKCNIHTSCLVVNQCDSNANIEEDREFGKVRMINTMEHGLSKSRNMALRNSHADICVICDDDVVYRTGYETIISNAFSQLPDAVVIVFNINSLNPETRPQEKLFEKISRIPHYKTYSSVHIAFRRKCILSAGISFDERFGSGSGLYSMGEDSLFFTKIHQAKLRAYTYPATIADLSSETSTWFKGYNEKYFYDVGAFLAAAFPCWKRFLMFYYPVRFKKLSNLPAAEILRCINHGMKGFENNIPYNATLANQNKKGEKLQ